MSFQFYSPYGEIKETIPATVEDGYIVFEDGTWLSREEYDGSEWWRYNKAPDEPDIPEGKTIVIEDYQCPDDEDDEEVDNESGGNKSDLS